MLVALHHIFIYKLPGHTCKTEGLQNKQYNLPLFRNHPTATANIVKSQGFDLFSFVCSPLVNASQRAWAAYLTRSVGLQVPALLITSYYTVCEVAVSSYRVPSPCFESQSLRILWKSQEGDPDLFLTPLSFPQIVWRDLSPLISDPQFTLIGHCWGKIAVSACIWWAYLPLLLE